MVDFYKRKLTAYKQCEDAIKACTQAGTKADEAKLIAEINRMTGFSTVIKKHIEGLITSREVQRTFDSSGIAMLEWSGKNE